MIQNRYFLFSPFFAVFVLGSKDFSVKAALGISEGFRGYVSHRHCLEHDKDYSMLNLNGTLTCAGASCKLKCNKGYDYWKRGTRRVACKSSTGICYIRKFYKI